MAVVKIRVSDPGYGTSVAVAHGPEDASQTYERNAVLIADVATGEVLEASTEPVDLILGIAHGAASGTTGNDVMYTRPMPGMNFIGSIGTSLTAGAIAADDLFAEYPLALDTGDWFVDKTDNTSPCVRVTEFIDAVGTTNGLVKFEFLKSALLYQD